MQEEYWINVITQKGCKDYRCILYTQKIGTFIRGALPPPAWEAFPTPPKASGGLGPGLFFLTAESSWPSSEVLVLDFGAGLFFVTVAFLGDSTFEVGGAGFVTGSEI